VSRDARLVALNLATGAVRWTLRFPGRGLYGSQAIAADGALAVLLPNGVVEAADLSTGRVLWARGNGISTGPLAFGGVVVAGSNGRAIGYDARTGRVLWTAYGLPDTTVLTAADGLALVQSDVVGGGQSTDVTALVPGTGRVAWRLPVNPSVWPTILGAGPAGIGMSLFGPDQLFLVSPLSGRPRWTAAAFSQLPPTAPLQSPAQIITAGSVVTVEGRGVPRLVDRRATDGKVLWSVPLTGYSNNIMQLALTPGPDVVLTLGPSGSGVISRLWVFRLATGTLAGSAVLPTLVTAPLAVAGDDVLMQLDDPGCGIALAAKAALAS
jgi:outer membrane protein assembly factor BamB